jgi:hypothetical protein
MIDGLKEMGQYQARAKEMFLFEENVELYLQILKKKEDVSPEMNQQYK